MRRFLCIALLGLACRYDTSGVLHLEGDEPLDAARADEDANPTDATEATDDTGPPTPVPLDAGPADADVPPDAVVPPDAGSPEGCEPACGPLEVCCDDGTCAGLGLCF